MHEFNDRKIIEIILAINVICIWTVDGICESLESKSTCLEWRKCRESNDMERLSRLSLLQCWEQCRIRPHCKGINYWRRKQSCDIKYNLIDGDLLSTARGPCVRIRQTSESPTSCSWCGIRTSCDADRGVCTATACPPLNATGGKVYGNIVSVGSLAKVVYPIDPSIHIHPVCQSNSLWSLVLSIQAENSFSIMIYNQRRNQEGATQTCADANQTLIRMDSKEKFFAVLEFLNSIPGYDGIQYWVQGKHVNGVWRFENGDRFNYAVVPFRDMNGRRESCTRMITGNNPGLNDRLCSFEFGFMCESTNV